MSRGNGVLYVAWWLAILFGGPIGIVLTILGFTAWSLVIVPSICFFAVAIGCLLLALVTSFTARATAYYALAALLGVGIGVGCGVGFGLIVGIRPFALIYIVGALAGLLLAFLGATSMRNYAEHTKTGPDETGRSGRAS
jgi:hypothetical protein